MATILQAVRDGNTKALEDLLSKGVPLDETDNKGRTCLDLALEKKQYDALKLLLQSGADIEKNGWGQQAIKALCKKGKKKTKVIEALVQSGFDLNVDVGKGDTVLLFVLKSGLLEVIPCLLALGADVKVRDRYGDQPIHIAASRGFSDITRQLLQKGANPDAFNGQGQRPIHLACYNGHTDVCRELIKRKADLNAKTKLHADTPLKVAFSHVCNDMVKTLIKNGVDLRDDPSCDFSPLLTAVNTQNLDLVNLCLEHGAPVTRKALERSLREGFISIFRALFESPAFKQSNLAHGLDLLMLALEYGYFEIAKILLEGGVKVDDKAMIDAVHNEQEELLKLFLDHGKNNMNKLDALLSVAIRRQNVEICSILLSHGADGNYSHDGQPVLHQAISKGNIGLIKLLMEYGAEVGEEAFKLAVDGDQTDLVRMFLEHGDRPDGHHSQIGNLTQLLARAVANKNAEITKLLLDSGADPTALDEEGSPILYSAIEGGRSDLVQLLLDFGAKVDRGAMRKAVKSENPEMMDMLLDKADDDDEEILDELLDLAIRSTNAGIAKLLLRRGADGTRRSRGGTSVLSLAIDSGRMDLVRMLLEHGAVINEEAIRRAVVKNQTELVKAFLDHSQQSSECLDDLLALAIKNNNPDIVRLLLQHGADANHENNGEPMLHKAAGQGRLDLVTLLLQNGALAFGKDGKGLTAIELAKKLGHDNIVNTLLKHAVELCSDAFYKKHNSRAYRMCGKHRGSALIINIQYKTGTQHRRSSISLASQPNTDDVRILFAQLGFRISEIHDCSKLTAKGIKERVRQFADELTEEDQCVAVIVTGRVGANNTIVATDGMPVNIEEGFLKVFDSEQNPALKKKPKFFLFESAKGRSESTRTPKHSDVVVGFSTQLGPIAYRDTNPSSYMEVLVQVFKELACELHLVDLLTEVQRRLVEDNNNNNGSVPNVAYASSLCRPLYLFPGIWTETC